MTSEFDRRMEAANRSANAYRLQQEWTERCRARSGKRVSHAVGEMADVIQQFWTRVPESEKVTGYVLTKPMAAGTAMRYDHIVETPDLILCVEQRHVPLAPPSPPLKGRWRWKVDAEKRKREQQRLQHIEDTHAIWRVNGDAVRVAVVEYTEDASESSSPSLMYIDGDRNILAGVSTLLTPSKMMDHLVHWLNRARTT